jgi:hypothetical protein
MKKISFVFYFVIVIILYSFINTYIRANIEYKKRYNFTITKIQVTPTHSLEFITMKKKSYYGITGFPIPKMSGPET